jgi:hypothetical protein
MFEREQLVTGHFLGEINFDLIALDESEVK